MFQLVLVDDKRDVVEGIAGAKDWKSIGVEVHCFYNGLEAKEYILNNHSDMVITDIKMPFMTGLELAKAVSEQCPQVRFVILSGYDDFIYAKEAIHLGVVEYLTKPVEIDEIVRLVMGEKERSCRQREEQALRSNLYSQYSRSLPLMKNDWFLEFMDNRNSFSKKRLLDAFKANRIELSPENLITVTVQLDHAGEGDDLLCFIIENVAREIIDGRYSMESFRCQKRYVVFFMNYSPNQSMAAVYYNLYVIFSEVKQRVEQLISNTISIGIGEVAERIEELKASCESGRKILSERFYFGKGCILSPPDIPKRREADFMKFYPGKEEQLLLKYIKFGEENMESLVDSYIEKLKVMKGFPEERIRQSMMSFVISVCNQNEKAMNMQTYHAMEELKRLETLDEISLWLKDLFKQAEAGREEDAGVKRSVLKVKEYIDQHYAENLTLKKMADYVYLSQSYLSVSFKEILHMNFNEYLTRVRMEKAKELLGSSRYRIYEVCSMVGYTDKKYFSDLFKRYTGMLPKEWEKMERSRKSNGTAFEDTEHD